MGNYDESIKIIDNLKGSMIIEPCEGGYKSLMRISTIAVDAMDDLILKEIQDALPSYITRTIVINREKVREVFLKADKYDRLKRVWDMEDKCEVCNIENCDTEIYSHCAFSLKAIDKIYNDSEE